MFYAVLALLVARRSETSKHSGAIARTGDVGGLAMATIAISFDRQAGGSAIVARAIHGSGQIRRIKAWHAACHRGLRWQFEQLGIKYPTVR